MTPSGPVLGIETSGRLTGAAVVHEGRLLAEAAEDLEASSQERLLSIVDRLLADLGLRLPQLSRIGVAVGPGSFTGLRVGVGATRLLAFGSGIPAVAVPSHEALALPLAGVDAALALLTGFRKGRVFLEVGEWVGLEWRPLFPAASVAVEDLVRTLEGGDARPPRPLLLLGEALEYLLPEVPRLRDLGTPLLDPLLRTRRPAAVAFLAARPGVRLLGPDLLDRLEPLYLRGADARRPGERGPGGG